MTLIVEDGTIVAGANSYSTVEQLNQYAEARQIDLPAGLEAKEAILIEAGDYTNSFRAKYQGCKISGAQDMQFPRSGVYVDTFVVASDEIPADLIKAQLQAAIEIVEGQDLNGTVTSNVKREKVDVLETEYFSPQEGGIINPVYPKVDAFLKPLLKNGGSNQILLSPIR